MKKLLTASLMLAALACGKGPATKVMIIGNGRLEDNATAENLRIKPGSSYLEHEFDVKGENAQVKATVGSEEKTATLQGQGYFLWNLKTDTLVGSRQNLGTASVGTTTITQEMLNRKIDSLVQLTQNQNVSEANKNYFVEPGQVVKLSQSTNVMVSGPFHKLPQQLDETKYNTETEVFKFYTVKELREEIDRLRKMTAPKPE